MTEKNEYTVELEVFEGPLDLLLYLIKKEEVDVYDIPIETITTQYMEYLGVMQMLDLEIAGEFLVMAATLMMIKSRMLLPVEERDDLEEEEEDPRWELVKQLLEYKKYKDAAAALKAREFYQENVFGLGGEVVVGTDAEDKGLVLEDVSLFDLISAFNDVLKNAKPEEIGQIVGHQYTVEDKIDSILRTIRLEKKTTFRSLFNSGGHRHEIVCTFLALLELIRLRHIDVVQDGHCGEIIVQKAEGEDDE